MNYILPQLWIDRVFATCTGEHEGQLDQFHSSTASLAWHAYVVIKCYKRLSWAVTHESASSFSYSCALHTKYDIMLGQLGICCSAHSALTLSQHLLLLSLWFHKERNLAVMQRRVWIIQAKTTTTRSRGDVTLLCECKQQQIFKTERKKTNVKINILRTNATIFRLRTSAKIRSMEDVARLVRIRRCCCL